MREIKFRAWAGKMEYDITVGKFGVFYVNKGKKGDGLDENDSACLTSFNTVLAKCTPVMQFTGLKDKNGKEIYEGDILICSEYDSSDCSRGVVQTFKNATVEFRHGCFWYCVNGNPHQLLMYGYKPEIIGNIYENPELLTKP